MPAPLSREWIARQIEVCERARDGAYPGQYAQFSGAAQEHYLATLESLQAAQGELRTVYAILSGLHLAIDGMAHEKIKECLGQLLVAGAEWLEEPADAS